jgi:hypothetical protein
MPYTETDLEEIARDRARLRAWWWRMAMHHLRLAFNRLLLGQRHFDASLRYVARRRSNTANARSEVGSAVRTSSTSDLNFLCGPSYPARLPSYTRVCTSHGASLDLEQDQP